MANKKGLMVVAAGAAAVLLLAKKDKNGAAKPAFDAATQAHQINLKVLGYDPDLDGMRPLGPKSILAIQKFQADAGLLPTGVFDNNTTEALNDAVRAHANQEPNVLYAFIMGLIEQYGTKAVEAMHEQIQQKIESGDYS